MAGRYALPKKIKPPPGGYRPGGGRPRLTDEQRAERKVRRSAVAATKRMRNKLQAAGLFEEGVQLRVAVGVDGANAALAAPPAPTLGSSILPAPAEPPKKRPRFTTPLAYAMHLINDPEVPEELKLRAAVAALPFRHPKLAEKPLGKKEQAQKDAQNAGHGDGWGDLLDGPAPEKPKLVVDNDSKPRRRKGGE